MKKLKLIHAIPSVILLGAVQSFAAVLFSLPAAQVITGGGTGTAIVDTTNDTGDWITAGGYSTGAGTVPLYLQVTMNITNNAGETGGGGFFTGFQLFKAGGENFAVGNSWGSLNWGGFQAPADYEVTGNPAYILGTPASFVIKLDQAQNTATVYYNPNLALSEVAQGAAKTTVLSGMGVKDEFDSLNIRAGNGTGSNTFSNIVVRNDSPFAAVPEPGSALLAGIASLGLIRRRRA
ncbi:MAG: PEP-CTERM sorting domain-containing protein [Verrucomicrobiota bacterium]